MSLKRCSAFVPSVPLKISKVDYTHKISAPVEIWESQDDNGKVASLEVTNRNGARTILAFKS